MKTKKVKKTSSINFKHLFERINTFAPAMELNTLPEVGVFDAKVLQDVAEFLISLPGVASVSSDNLPYTPRMERIRVAINTAFNLNLNCFHVWQIVLSTRKNGILPKSSTSRKTGMLLRKS